MTRRNLIVVGVAAVVVLAAVVAVVAGGGDDESTDTTSEYGSPSVTGSALAEFTGEAVDPAVGRPAPRIAGTDFDGGSVEIGGTGEPQLVLFVAHWCPHCQAEVPRIVSWVGDGSLPDDVPIRAVATSTTPQRPNFPPSAWLDAERWRFPVLVDDEEGTAGRAYGLSSFPYFVAVGGDGTVRARASGELSLEQLRSLLRTLDT